MVDRRLGAKLAFPLDSYGGFHMPKRGDGGSQSARGNEAEAQAWRLVVVFRPAHRRAPADGAARAGGASTSSAGLGRCVAH